MADRGVSHCASKRWENDIAHTTTSRTPRH